jgi:hypothetical protein
MDRGREATLSVAMQSKGIVGHFADDATAYPSISC